jgi:hypothetical protein
MTLLTLYGFADKKIAQSTKGLVRLGDKHFANYNMLMALQLVQQCIPREIGWNAGVGRSTPSSQTVGFLLGPPG